MKHWPTKPLGDFIAKRSGTVDPSRFPHEIFDLYSIPAFDSGEPEVRAGNEIGSAKQIVEPGDVLLSRIVPHIRRAWVVGVDRGRRLIGSGEWIVFRSPQFHPHFLRYFLVGDPFHGRFMQTVSGVGGSLLRAKATEVAKIEVPMPPLAEQERIVKLLDEADDLRKLRARADRRTDALIPAIFHEMFGSSAQPWDSVPLGDLVQEFRYGTSNKSTAEGKPTLRIPNVVGQALNLDDLKFVPVSGSEFDRLRLQDGDLLFVRTNGNADFIGRSAVFDARAIEAAGFEASEFIYASYLIRARLQADRAQPIFVQHFLRSPVGVRALRARSKTSAGQFNINTEGLGTIPVPVPPLALQKEFAQRVTEIRPMEATQTAGRQGLETLFQSMLYRAFAAEL